jgi:membrane fusion protein, multidrug efflux system
MLPPVKIPTSDRRLWWIRPRTILFAIGTAILIGIAADRVWIRANGIVAGQLVAVSPIVQARLQKLFVECLDHVTTGQRVAEFVNEATVEAAAQQLQQLQLQLTQARASILIAEKEASTARKLVDAQKVLLGQQKNILKAMEVLVKQSFVGELVWMQARAAVDHADAQVLAAEFVYDTKIADKQKAELDAEILQKRIDSFLNSPELTGHFYLSAPTDGIVTQCTVHPGEVVAPRTPIFSIFNPKDTFAVVFFDPSDVAKLARGQSFEISVQSFDKPVHGTVTGFYPELSALPSSLTRYFWQQEKWSQYAPVRLDFTNLSDTQRSRLFAWAQLSASRWTGWRVTSVLEWVQQHLNGAWQFVAAGFVQRPIDR